MWCSHECGVAVGCANATGNGEEWQSNRIGGDEMEVVLAMKKCCLNAELGPSLWSQQLQSCPLELMAHASSTFFASIRIADTNERRPTSAGAPDLRSSVSFGRTRLVICSFVFG